MGGWVGGWMRISHLLGVLVAHVFVRVPLEGQGAIGLANGAVLGVRGDFQDGVWVELGDFLCR